MYICAYMNIYIKYYIIMLPHILLYYIYPCHIHSGGGGISQTGCCWKGHHRFPLTSCSAFRFLGKNVPNMFVNVRWQIIGIMEKWKFLFGFFYDLQTILQCNYFTTADEIHSHICKCTTLYFSFGKKKPYVDVMTIYLLVRWK
jgi:hypothetical protein